MKKVDIKERIAEGLKMRNMTQQELANKTKIPKSSISQYLSGFVKPKQERIYLISEALNVDETWLLGYDVPFERGKSMSSIKKVKLPILGSVACGVPTFEEEEHDYYFATSLNCDIDFCLIAKGDSMINAKINDGDIIFIKKQGSVNNGEIALVLIDDETTLKRFYYYQDKNMIILKAENPKYEDLIYMDEELAKIKILGKAIFLQTEIQ